jgi:hypothetical protein
MSFKILRKASDDTLCTEIHNLHARSLLNRFHPWVLHSSKPINNRPPRQYTFRQKQVMGAILAVVILINNSLVLTSPVMNFNSKISTLIINCPLGFQVDNIEFKITGYVTLAGNSHL